jgi:hypothetical protein
MGKGGPLTDLNAPFHAFCGRAERKTFARYRNGLLKKRDPVSPYRHGSSTAFEIPMRRPTEISVLSTAARSSNGGRSNNNPLWARVIPSA